MQAVEQEEAAHSKFLSNTIPGSALRKSSFSRSRSKTSATNQHNAGPASVSMDRRLDEDALQVALKSTP
jgi:hypothetical protein